MKTTFVEACNVVAGKPGNWGKFMLARFEPEEWDRPPTAPGVPPALPLLETVGWGGRHLLVLDLQTGEGALFRPGGLPSADLEKHALWVCPLFGPFLGWLYRQDLSDLDALPRYVELADADFAFSVPRGGAVALEALRKIDEIVDNKSGHKNTDLLARIGEVLDGVR